MASFNDIPAIHKLLTERHHVLSSLLAIKSWENFHVVVQGQDRHTKQVNAEADKEPKAQMVSMMDLIRNGLPGNEKSTEVLTAHIIVPDPKGIIQAFFVRYCSDQLAGIDHELEALGFDLPEGYDAQEDADKTILNNYIIGVDAGRPGGDTKRLHVIPKEECPDCGGQGYKIDRSNRPGILVCGFCQGKGKV